MQEEHILPLHWSCYFDHLHQSFYYHNDEDGVTQWERPYQYAKYESTRYNGKNRTSASPMPQHMLQSVPSSAQSHFVDTNNGTLNGDVENDDAKHTAPSYSPEEGHHFSVHQFASSPVEYQTKRDYLEMARLYTLQRPYNNDSNSKSCLLCRMNQATHVFFPCEHRCVCEGCIEYEEICSHSDILSRAHGCCSCPLCAAVIKRIIPFDNGHEIEEYWSWIYEYPPRLPENFKKVILWT